MPLDPAELSATSATTLTKEKDLSVVATVSNGLGNYKVVAHTDLVGITAVRLEVLPDARHPTRGRPQSRRQLRAHRVRADRRTQGRASENDEDRAGEPTGRLQPEGLRYLDRH